MPTTQSVGRAFFAAVFCLLFVGVGGLMVLVTLRSEEPRISTLLAGLFFVGCGLVVAAGPIQQLLARAAFRTAELRCASGDLRLGGFADVHVTLEPRRLIQLNRDRCVLAFVSTERAHYRAGTDSRTYEEVIARHVVPIALPELLEGVFETRVRVPIPPDVPPTWSGQSNWLINTVQLQLDTEGWPDLTIETALDVAGERAS